MHRRSTVLPRILLACLLGGPGVAALPLRPPTGDPQEQLEQVEKDLRAETKQLREMARETEDDDTVAQMYAEYYRDVLPEFLERFAAIARENRGTEGAEAAWGRVIRYASASSYPSAVAREALVALTTDHIQSEQLGETCAALRYGIGGLGEEPVIQALETLGEKSPHSAVRARALFALGAVLGEDRAENDPRLARARSTFRRVIDEYAEQPSLDGRPCGEAARAFLFALDNLRVGQPCPDFEAVDAEGAPFKLSDYKGKVVLVDFWGFW